MVFGEVTLKLNVCIDSFTRETFFLVLVTPRVSLRPIFRKKTKKKRFCRLSIGEKLAIQYHIKYC